MQKLRLSFDDYTGRIIIYFNNSWMQKLLVTLNNQEIQLRNGNVTFKLYTCLFQDRRVLASEGESWNLDHILDFLTANDIEFVIDKTLLHLM